MTNPALLDDYNAIVHAAELYLEGCAKGSGDIVKPAFHKNSTINGEPIQTLFDGADKAGPTDCKGRVDIRDVSGTVAAVRVVLLNYHGADYVDYHVLKKTPDGWKIMAKVYADA